MFPTACSEPWYRASVPMMSSTHGSNLFLWRIPKKENWGSNGRRRVLYLLSIVSFDGKRKNNDTLVMRYWYYSTRLHIKCTRQVRIQWAVKARLHVPSPSLSPSRCLSLCEWRQAFFLQNGFRTHSARRRPVSIDTIDFFLFLFRFLVEFDEFYRVKKLSMDIEHHYAWIPYRIHG